MFGEETCSPESRRRERIFRQPAVKVTAKKKLRVRIRLILLSAISFLVVIPARTQNASSNETIIVDANAASHPFPHFWEKMFGSGRAILSLRDS